MTPPPPTPAFVDGAPVPLAFATRKAAAMLAAARRPVFAGLGTDVAGVRAALALAERFDGTVEHMRGAALSREAALLAEGKAILVTPDEARARADVVVIAGDLAAAAPWIGRIFGPGPAAVLGDEPARRVVLLGTFKHAGEAVAAGTLAARLGSGPADTAAIVAALRARLAGRAVNLSVLAEADRAGLDAAVEALRGARYGVVLCDAATLDDLALDLVAGLVADLNRAGRFALLPFPGADDAAGAALVHAWTTGFMPPVGFRGGRVRHDAWEFSAARMIESGEADLLVWISAMSPTPPAWTSVPTVALLAPGTRLSVTPEVVVTVAPPAAGAVVHDAFAASLVALAEPEPHPSLPSVAAVLAGVAAEIAGGVA